MNPLPQPPAGSLHLLPPWLLPLLLFLLLLALLLLVLAILFALWRRRKRRQQRLRERLGEHVQPPSDSDTGDWFTPQVEEIVQSHTRQGSFRDGCHALATAVKRRLEELSGIEMEEKTVTEIKSCLAERKVEKHLLRLRQAQYGKQPPGKNELNELGKQCTSLLGKKRRLRLQGSR